jgi:mono/diheme cytochrome c family protein
MSRAPLGVRRAVALFAAGALAWVVPLPAQQVPEDEAARGPGRDLFIARCSSCHSVDYVRMHAPFGTRALWEASVAKMRNAFKAPLDDDEARTIVDYLAVAYAPPPAPPAASADDRQ